MSEFDFRAIVTFWFEETAPKDWWKGTPHFDQLIKTRFLDFHAPPAGANFSAGGRIPLEDWRKLSSLINFPRHIHRGTPAAFVFDSMATDPVPGGGQKPRAGAFLPPAKSPFSICLLCTANQFVSMKSPWTFSPSLAWKETSNTNSAIKAIIERFGRYPHRNLILGRKSTREEEEFLTQAGSSF